MAYWVSHEIGLNPPKCEQLLAELFRVLKTGGWAILQTPISGDVTIEDSTAQTAEERLRRFGQRDLVRIYSRDYAGWLVSVGVAVTVDD
ncbi:MAG: hypothetical protein WEC79_00740 [Thermomicrobiales bacterium]